MSLQEGLQTFQRLEGRLGVPLFWLLDPAGDPWSVAQPYRDLLMATRPSRLPLPSSLLKRHLG